MGLYRQLDNSTYNIWLVYGVRQWYSETIIFVENYSFDFGLAAVIYRDECLRYRNRQMIECRYSGVWKTQRRLDQHSEGIQRSGHIHQREAASNAFIEGVILLILQ